MSKDIMSTDYDMALTPSEYRREAPKAATRPVQVEVPQRRPDWHRQARCTGLTSVFFLESGQNANRAKALCKNCPVREECLEWALENREVYGVWGGLSERERNAILRTRTGRQLKHGLGGYQTGCRCDVCRAAYRLYTRQYRAKQTG